MVAREEGAKRIMRIQDALLRLFVVFVHLVLVRSGVLITPDADGYVEIDSSYTSIPAGAFKQCAALKYLSIEIP